METAHLLAFNLAVLSALVSPGPAFLAILRTTLSLGRLQGLGCALGLGLAATGWSALALAGLSALFAVAPWSYLALKLGGAAYLLWLAVSLWRGADRPAPSATPSGPAGLRLGLLTNMANPKAVVFIAAILTTVFPAMPEGQEALLVLANHLALEVLWYGAVALVLSTAPMRAAYTRAKGWFDRAAAGLLALMALRTAT